MFKNLMRATRDENRIIYFRADRAPAVKVYGDSSEFEPGKGVVFHTEIWYHIQYDFCYVMRRDLRPERYWEERYDDPRHPVSFGIALPYQGR